MSKVSQYGDFQITLKNGYLYLDNINFDIDIKDKFIHTIKICKSQINIPRMLSKLVNLTRVEIYNCDITDIDFLLPNTKLSYLWIESDSILSLKGISNFRNLEELHLNNTKITNYAEIFEITNLENLTIIDCGVKNIDGIGNLSKLERLNIDRNQITDISELRNLNFLDKVEIWRNPVNLTNINLYSCSYAFMSCLHVNDIIKKDYNDVSFDNYKKRILLSLSLPIRKNKIRNMWFSFFEGRRDNQGYNRLSYFSF